VARLNADVDVLADREANAGDRLHCEMRFAVVDHSSTGSTSCRRQVDTSPPDTATEIAAEAIFVAEVQEGVDHA